MVNTLLRTSDFVFDFKSTKFISDSNNDLQNIHHNNNNKAEKGTSSLQGTLSISPTVYFCMELIHFQLLKRGQPLYKGQNGWSQSVFYSLKFILIILVQNNYTCTCTHAVLVYINIHTHTQSHTTHTH